MSGAISALLIGEPDDLDARAVRAVLEHIAGRPATVTITGVAARVPLIWNWSEYDVLVVAGRRRRRRVAGLPRLAVTPAGHARLSRTAV